MDFVKLIYDARKIVRQVPVYQCLYGSFDETTLPEVVQRKQRKPVQVQQKSQLKKLENVVATDKDEQNIDEIISFLQNVLQEEFVKNNSEPINYYKYIVDSDSFAATVENMFYFSFLIRNGKAAMDTG